MEYLLIFGLALSMLVVWRYINVECGHAQALTGDGWHWRRMAATGEPVSAPYCWRPLFPFLGGIFGLRQVTYVCYLVVPMLMYGYGGGGGRGMAFAFLGIFSPFLGRFFARSWDYADAMNFAVAFGVAWALEAGAYVALPLAVLAGCSREVVAWTTIVLAIGHGNWWAAVAAGAAAMLCYVFRNEAAPEITHPLNAEGGERVATLRKWLTVKGDACLDYAHTIHVFSPLAFGLPFVWGQLGDGGQFALVAGVVGCWGLSLPASGQSRGMLYAWPVLIPAFKLLPVEWLWGLALLHVWWPWVRYVVFDETGGNIIIDPVTGRAEMATPQGPQVLTLPPPNAATGVRPSDGGMQVRDGTGVLQHVGGVPHDAAGVGGGEIGGAEAGAAQGGGVEANGAGGDERGGVEEEGAR